MDERSLFIEVEPVETGAADRGYTVRWEEKGDDAQLSGSVQAWGPSDLARDPSDDGLAGVCAWLLDIAWAPDDQGGDLGWALCRMDSRAEMDSRLTQGHLLGQLQVTDHEGHAWKREWPYSLVLEELAERGARQRFSRQLDERLGACELSSGRKPRL